MAVNAATYMCREDNKAVSKNSFVVFMSYIFYVLFLAQGYIGNFEGSVVEISYFLIVALPLCLTIRRIDLICLLVLLCIPLYVFNKSFITVFLIYSFVFLLKTESLRRIAACNVLVDIIIIILIPILLDAHVTKDTTSNLAKGVAHSLGFVNSNSLGLSGFYFMVSLYFLLHNRFKWSLIVVLIFLNEIIFSFACSRTAWSAGYVLILLSAAYFSIGINKKLRYIFAIFPIVCVVVIFYVLNHWQEYGVLDVFLSRRISILGGLLEQMSTFNYLFGKTFDGYPIDCAYVGIVFSGGIGWLLFFLFTYWKTCTQHFNKLKPYLPAVFALLVSGIGENTFISPNGASILFWSAIIRPLLNHNHERKQSIGIHCDTDI